MKRHSIALLIHPYKNVLIKQDAMQGMLDAFAEKLVAVTHAHPNLRINLTLPGYMLQLLNPLILSKLNELQKSNCLEWLTPGYTEPFLSFSPQWLCGENIKCGLDTFEQLVGARPCGYVPPFSNWEPCLIPVLNDNRINYAVLSRTLLPASFQAYCGYWIAEHLGHAMAVIPFQTLHYYNAPASVAEWMENSILQSPDKSGPLSVVIDYLVPLIPHSSRDPFRWLASFAESLDTLLITCQMNLLHELPTLAPPLGLQSIASSLAFKHENSETLVQCSNYLHTFDTVGIMQRKMMDVAENIRAHGDSREMMPLLKQLFAAQDINRYLPNTASGFKHLRDRFWTFGQMVAIDHALQKRDKISGGQIRIADYLKNGTKSIIMSNKSLKVYIDHKNGGQIFELDFLDRASNLMTCFNPACHTLPRIIAPGKSPTSFTDYFCDQTVQPSEFINGTVKHYGDFIASPFEYKIKKTASSVKTILSRQGSIALNGKPFPITMEKVFGLEKDKPELSFVYQLSNHALTTYAFTLAVEINLSLPGMLHHQVELIDGRKKRYTSALFEKIVLEEATESVFVDRKTGVEIRFKTQKPVTLLFYPAALSSPYQGTKCLLLAPVSLAENGVWSLMGKLICRKTAIKGTVSDVV